MTTSHNCNSARPAAVGGPIPYGGHRDGLATKNTEVSKEDNPIVVLVIFVANSSSWRSYAVENLPAARSHGEARRLRDRLWRYVCRI